MPRLSIEMSLGNRTLQLSGIIDSGSALNVCCFRAQNFFEVWRA